MKGSITLCELDAGPGAVGRSQGSRDAAAHETRNSIFGCRATADPLVAALARYVEALHRRYPDGPEQLRREGLDARAKVSEMVRIRKVTAG